MTLYDEFIHLVENKILLSNRLVKLAVERHQNDINKSAKKSYPWTFDRYKADLAIKVIKLLRHPIGSVAGQYFKLKPYHAFIVASIFGWVSKKTGKRKIRRVYVEMARKGVKSELAAAIGIVALVFDQEEGPQVYTIATQKDQAKIVFHKAVEMLKMLRNESPRVKQNIRILGGDRPERIICYKNKGFMEPFSSESTTKDGHDPHVVICDEYHAHKTDNMLNVMTSGMGARAQPLVVIITTAGFNVDGPCYAERDVVINILNGITQNDTIFGIIWTLDDDDDWHDKTCWIKSAPNIGETPTWEFMEAEYQKALEGVTKEVEFKTKLLNIWTSSSVTWIKELDLKKVLRKLDITLFAGREAIGSLDLAYAASGDIVAYGITILPTVEDPFYYSIPYYFVSSEKIGDRKRKDGVNYKQWHRDNHLIEVPGNIIDDDYIKKEIFYTAELLNLKAVMYDRWNSSSIITELAKENINVLGFGQGYGSMSGPVNETEKFIKSKKLIIHDNPVTRWMFRNVQLQFDSAANVKINKGSPEKKVDGIITMVMGIGGASDKNIKQLSYSGGGPVML
jgi:phage terminase large subunit-like protein